MTESRRDCVVDALQRYSETRMDEQSKSWVLRWLTNGRRRPDNTILAPLIDNMDDWIKLEARSYADDDLLKYVIQDGVSGLVTICCVHYFMIKRLPLW